jgi:hypothetical protein
VTVISGTIVGSVHDESGGALPLEHCSALAP